MRRSVLAEKVNGLEQAERRKGVKEKEIGYSSSEEEPPSSNIGMRRRKGELAKMGGKIKVGDRTREGWKRNSSTKKWRQERPPPFNQNGLGGSCSSERSLVGLAGCFGGAEAYALAAQKNRPHAERLLAGCPWSHDLDSEEERP